MDFIAAPAPIPLDYRVQEVLQRGRSELDPWVESAAASFGTKLPIPPSCDTFSSDGFFRLKWHHRSICFAPGDRPVRNVLCVKGMEPFAPDFGGLLDKLATHRWTGSGQSLLEHFILEEDKLPGCLLFNEACIEASIAAKVHVRLSSDGEPLPRLPLPLLCGRLPDTALESAVREITARASRSLWPKIEMLAGAGLGAYVYWYPSLPLRAADFQVSRTSAISMSDGWIGLASRLLRAGFLPTTAHSLGRGQCCDPRNSVIDGGFADLGSVIPVEEVRARRDVFIAAQMTIWHIAETILHVLGRPLGREGSPVARFDYGAQMVLHIVRARLARACGQTVDPTLIEFFGASETLAGFARLLDQT
jgi:hypothetical protein